MTASTVMPGSAISRRSEGTAKSGVPQKIMRIRRSTQRRLPLAGLPQFADAALDQVPFEHAQMLEEEDPIQVIYLMGEGAGEQSFTLHLERLPVKVLGANRHIGGPQDVP